MSDFSISGISLLLILLTVFWSFRGLINIFERHDSSILILYIIFLFPIAYIHMFLLGVFGSSKKKRKLRQAEKDAQLEKLLAERKGIDMTNIKGVRISRKTDNF